MRDSMETQRLLLRRPRFTDAATIFRRYASDPEVTRYLTWSPHRDVAETEAFLRHCEDGWSTGREFTWTVTLKAQGTIVGMVACRPNRFKAELGYVLARAYWNRGYMTEAVSAVVETVLSLPGMYRVGAVCDVDNGASARVLEKAGMTREGTLRRWIVHPNVSDQPRDCLVYSIVR